MATKHIADAEGCFTCNNVTPDFCRVGKDVIPFDISRTLKPKKACYANSVFARGAQTLTIQSIIAGVDGNAGKGVKSGVSQADGSSEVQGGSGSVFVEGKKTARHGDEVLMNGVFAPGPKGQGKPSGLGEGADKLIEQSPTLQKDLEKLKEDGWKIEYGPKDGGSACYRDLDPPTIVLDSSLKNDPTQAVQVLSHEVGHATYPYKADYNNLDKYVNGALADEGAATMKNIQVQREILVNGGPNIGIAGNAANHAQYNSIYDAALKSGDVAGARAQIGEIFRNGEIASIGRAGKKAYGSYYGDWYKEAFKK